MRCIMLDFELFLPISPGETVILRAQVLQYRIITIGGVAVGAK